MSSSEAAPRVLPWRPPELGGGRGVAPSALPFEVALDVATLVTRPPDPPTPEEAYRRGLAEGERRGREAATKAVAPLVEMLEELATIRERRLEALAEDLARLAAEIAERVLGEALALEPGRVVALARACIAAAGAATPKVLHVAAEDLERLRDALPELEGRAAESGLALRADPRLRPGEVVLEADGRFYDGRPRARLRALARHGTVTGSAREATP